MKHTDLLTKNNPDTLLLSRAEDKISTELDGETVILDLASGTYSGLNEVGTTIWNLLNEPKSFSAIQTAIEEKYAVSSEQCAADLASFLQELIDNNLLIINEK